jgi:hypothetical protein
MAPLLDTLKTAEELRGVGFTDAQAKLLTNKFEEVSQAVAQDLKAFIWAENEKLRSEIQSIRLEMDARMEALRADFQTLRADTQSALRDQTLKIVTLFAGLLALAVAIIKLFPNA